MKAKTIVGTITNIHPHSDLNVLGADNITLTGTNFPHQLEGSTFDLQFDDALKTKCVPQTSKTDTFVCLTNTFDKTVSLSKKYKMTVIINGQTISNAKELTMKNNLKKTNMLDPSSVSPVLK